MALLGGFKLQMAILVVGGLIGLVGAVMTAFLFDAPGSESNIYLLRAAKGLLALPVLCFVGCFLTWWFRDWSWKLIFILIPLVDVALISYCFHQINVVYGGRFDGPGR